MHLNSIFFYVVVCSMKDSLRLLLNVFVTMNFAIRSSDGNRDAIIRLHLEVTIPPIQLLQIAIIKSF